MLSRMLCESWSTRTAGAVVGDVDVRANGGFQLRGAADGPRRIRLAVRSANQRSTCFSHEALVGVKWR